MFTAVFIKKCQITRKRQGKVLAYNLCAVNSFESYVQFPQTNQYIQEMKASFLVEHVFSLLYQTKKVKNSETVKQHIWPRQ